MIKSAGTNSILSFSKGIDLAIFKDYTPIEKLPDVAEIITACFVAALLARLFIAIEHRQFRRDMVYGAIFRPAREVPDSVLKLPQRSIEYIVGPPSLYELFKGSIKRDRGTRRGGRMWLRQLLQKQIICITLVKVYLPDPLYGFTDSENKFFKGHLINWRPP